MTTHDVPELAPAAAAEVDTAPGAPAPVIAPAPTPQFLPAPAPSNGVALTAMIFGVVAAVVGFWAIVPITGYFSAALGFPLAVVAVICGHIGQSRAKKLAGIGRRFALSGVILGYASMAVMALASAAWTVFLFVGTI